MGKDVVYVEKKKSNFKSRVVIAVIVLNVIFTSAVLYVFLQTGSEPTTLIVSWFAFTTGEILACAGIEIKKNKKEETESWNG